MTAVRTVERGYTTRKRAGQVRRVHVIREEGPKGWEGPVRQTWCGQAAGKHQNSPAIIRDAPHALPDGLSWCPECIGHLAEVLGRLGDVARLIGVTR